MNIEERLRGLLSERLLTGESLSLHTSFRVGGPAELFASPQSTDELAAVVNACRETGEPFCILGNGTNVLVSDRGFSGVVISMRDMDRGVEITTGQTYGVVDREVRCVRASAGCPLSKVAMDSARAGLTGLEFAAGIPGSLGGAVVMNAGAYGGEISQVLLFATVLDRDGNVLRLSADELELSYRHSCVADKGYIVTDACFALRGASSIGILARIAELGEQRRTKQPLEYPSAGSTFKRPEGYFAGRLIEEAGLKGVRVGGAQVSEKHCGFVINADGATAADIAELIALVRSRVLEHSGVELEPEIRFIGEF